MSSWTRKIRTQALALAGTLLLAANAMAAVFNVDSTADEIDTDTSDGLCHTAANTCTLRAALMSANKESGADVTINVPAGIYAIVRPATANANDDSVGSFKLTPPAIGSPSITIVGAGAGTTIIDASQKDRALAVLYPRTALISGITFRNGLSPSDGGGIYNTGFLTLDDCVLSDNNTAFDGYGGGIFSTESLYLNRSTVSTNHAYSGGGIYSSGYMSASSCSLSGNTTDTYGSGGGIFNESGGTAFMDHCTLSGNMADEQGGGIENSGTLDVSHGTLSGNTATKLGGGGIHNDGTLDLEQTTVSGNNAALGGGIASSGPATVNQSTISGNAAHAYLAQPGNGGGISAYGVMTVTNSTIALNNADADGGGIYNDVGATANINIYSSTIAYNDADYARLGALGGGIFVTGSGGNGVNVYNTVVAGNTMSNAPIEDDCDTLGGGTLKTHARNLFGSTDGCTISAISGSYALLDPPGSLGGLQNNGGPTQTIALLRGSNAIDGTAVTGSLCFDGSAQIVVDQRGYARSGVCDVGAFEYDDIFADGFE